MAAVLEPSAFVAWLDDFLPPLTSREFAPLTAPVDPDEVMDDTSVVSTRSRAAATSGSTDAASDSVAAEAEEERAAAERRYLAGASHLIGLAFIRADAILRIVDALPPSDPRVPALLKIARLHGSQGFGAMFDADYAGSHWIGTFALKYLLEERGPGDAGGA
jgi:hypothetical protein